MESRAKLLGHAVHPIMIVFPLGLLSTGVIFDAIYLIWGNPTFAIVAYWMIAAGIVGGLIAAPFGSIDWLAIPSGTRAKTVGAMHGLSNVAALMLFIASWGMRYSQPENAGLTASLLSFAGLAFSGVGGWLGGELVERLGIGVDDNANVNAPNSLFTSSGTQRTGNR